MRATSVVILTTILLVGTLARESSLPPLPSPSSSPAVSLLVSFQCRRGVTMDVSTALTSSSSDTTADALSAPAVPSAPPSALVSSSSRAVLLSASSRVKKLLWAFESSNEEAGVTDVINLWHL